MFSEPWYAAVYQEENLIIFGRAPADNGYGAYLKVKERLSSLKPGKEPKVFLKESEIKSPVVFAEKKAGVGKGEYQKFKIIRRDLA